ncbi:MAG: DUF1573 domain-containing protein [Phycisphaerales bacterium]|nr:MAG: DUF1573 domain-containing protein [Phycisphaerales bacterium]
MDQPLIDLGRIEEGRTGEVVFAIQNRGDAPLEILDATTTCTCIRFEVPQRVLPPGERLFISARYVTTGHAGQESGAITLTTNDPQSPRTQLVITVDIDAAYEMEPLGQLRLQPQRPGLPCEPTLKLLPAKQGEPLEVLGVQMQADQFEVRREPYERDGRVGEELTLVGKGAQRRGALRDAMILAFRVGDEQKRVRIPVQLPLLGELAFDPKVLVSVNPTWRGRMIGKITVESTLGKPMQVLSATAVGPIDVSVEPVEPNRKYEVPVRVSADAPPGPFGAMVTIVTDLPAESVLHVPVYGNVNPYIWVAPEAVLMTVDPAAPHEAKAEVRLLWPVDAPVKLGEPQIDDKRLRVEVVPGEPEIRDGMELATATLRIFTASEAGPSISGLDTRIRLLTDWDRHSAVEVPVFVRAR